LNPPAKSFKPTAATIRPSDLDNQVLVDDNTPPRLHPAKNTSHGFRPPSKQVDLPTIEVTYRDDEESSDKEAAAGAERDFTLSSPMKQNLNSDVSWLPSLIEISDNFDIQDDLIVNEPPKALAARGKKRWQMSDLPRGMNHNDAWRKMLISTVYWHFGNQRDVWLYDDDELASDLGKIISAVYSSSLRQWVTVDGPIFRIVRIFFSI
jgi:hypothetical protein